LADNSEKEESQQLNEPSPYYVVAGKHSIRMSSFQQQEDEMAAYWASISPMQRMKHLHEMVIASYGLTEDKIKHPNLSRSIKVIANGR
jgi:hypothetical protein